MLVGCENCDKFLSTTRFAESEQIHVPDVKERNGDQDMYVFALPILSMISPNCGYENKREVENADNSRRIVASLN